MTILEALSRLVGPADALIAFLNRAGAAAPDLKPTADEWIGKLGAAASASNLVALAEALPKEIAAIAGGKLEPKDHPSDAV